MINTGNNLENGVLNSTKKLNNVQNRVPKKRHEENIDKKNVRILKSEKLPYEDLQNRITNLQIVKDGLKNAVNILERMKSMVYDDKDMDFSDKKDFYKLKEELKKEKKEMEKSVEKFENAENTENIKLYDEAEAEKLKRKHIDFIKNMKKSASLNSLHKGLTKEKVASLLS